MYNLFFDFIKLSINYQVKLKLSDQNYFKIMKKNKSIN